MPAYKQHVMQRSGTSTHVFQCSRTHCHANCALETAKLLQTYSLTCSVVPQSWHCFVFLVAAHAACSATEPGCLQIVMPLSAALLLPGLLPQQLTWPWYLERSPTYNRTSLTQGGHPGSCYPAESGLFTLQGTSKETHQDFSFDVSGAVIQLDPQ